MENAFTAGMNKGAAAGMHAVILAGGKGTRLMPFTVNFPKIVLLDFSPLSLAMPSKIFAASNAILNSFSALSSPSSSIICVFDFSIAISGADSEAIINFSSSPVCDIFPFLLIFLFQNSQNR